MRPMSRSAAPSVSKAVCLQFAVYFQIYIEFTIHGYKTFLAFSKQQRAGYGEKQRYSHFAEYRNAGVKPVLQAVIRIGGVQKKAILSCVVKDNKNYQRIISLNFINRKKYGKISLSNTRSVRKQCQEQNST